MTATGGAETCVSQALQRVAGAGIPVLRLATYDGSVLETGKLEVECLVHAQHMRRACRVLDALDWVYRVGGDGAWAMAPTVAYTWRDGIQLFVSRRLPLSPFLGPARGRLERLIWRTAAGRDGVLEADPSAALMYVALRALGTPEEYPREARRLVEAMAPRLPEAEPVARRVGLVNALRAAGEAVTSGEWDPAAAAADGRVAASLSQRMGRGARLLPRRFRGWLLGVPVIGAAPSRARVHGIELRIPPRAFVPADEAGLLARRVIESDRATAGSIVVDVGCATGGISLAVAARRPDLEVVGVELSAAAVRVARRNARRLGLGNVRFESGTLLDPLPQEARGKVSVVVANLPFYPQEQLAAVGEVAASTIGGSEADGLGLYRALLAQLPEVVGRDAEVIFQMFGWQWPMLEEDVGRSGFEPGDAIPAGPFVIAHACRAST